MPDLIKADAARMFRKKGFILSALFMVFLSVGLMYIQKTAMDYTVGLSRVIFLPMAFYGIVVAALVSYFVGTDRQSGMVGNKIIAGRSRGEIYFAGLIVSVLGCLAIYLLVVLTTVAAGVNLFDADTTAQSIFVCFLLGCLTCATYAAVFYALSMRCANMTSAMIVCMILSFAMLFLCLHTNQVLSQTRLKHGQPNLAYVDGVKRTVYLYLHDVNPSGQAAQLSSMQILSSARYIATDLAVGTLFTLWGAWAFHKKDL